MRFLIGLIWVGWCLLIGSCGKTRQPEIPQDVRISARARIEYGHDIGIVVGMVNPGGEAFFGYGRTELPNGSRPDERTVFEIGSVGAIFTSLLLADMAERGEVNFDDPIERYLPDSLDVPQREGRSITLMHLASHTSGLPTLPENFAPADQEYPLADFGSEEMYAFLSGHTLRRDIGTEYEYSIIGTGLLGHLLSLRAGKSFETLLEERLTSALGMPDTRFSMTPSMHERLARGHSGPRQVGTWQPRPALQGIGNELSTTRDLLTFLAANLGFVESPLRSAIEETQKLRFEAGSPTLQVGLGWHIKTDGEYPIVMHSGGTGGCRCFAGFVPETRTGVVVLSNSSTGIDDIGFHLLDPTIPLGEIRPPFPIPEDVLIGYEGTYVVAPPFAPGFKKDTHIDVEELDGWLTVRITGLARISMHAVSEALFVSPETGRTITFLRNEQGEVTGLVGEHQGLRQAARRVED